MFLSVDPGRQITLSVPDADALEHSQRLWHRIAEAIEQNHGQISFARYMEMALYEPGMGYYCSGTRKFGADGDFITAPVLSVLFPECIARHCVPVITSIAHPVILEPGPGSGNMAASLLLALERLQALPDEYWLLEVSAELRQRQKQYLQDTVPHHMHRIRWIEQFPVEGFEGIIIGNEILDALPVHRFRLEQGHMMELCVGLDGEQFNWVLQSPAPELQVAMDKQLSELAGVWSAGYQSEINTLIKPWLMALTDKLERGLALFIDYGYPRREYYHPQRTDGTLLCHYRHFAHGDPFLYPGLQDISASVDFTLLAESAVASGLHVYGYTTQAHFLMGNDLESVIMQERPGEPLTRNELNRQAQLLTLPGEMGEKFKVMALTRNLDTPLTGFQHFDQRMRL